jgi:hypothetical protein
VPAAVKLQQEFGDRLQVIFVESQGTGHEKSVGFALKAGWLGNNAIWTSQRPFSTGSGGLPSFALLDANGQVVLKGSSNAMHSQIVNEIERMVGKPDYGDIPKSVEKIYKELNKGKIASAYVMAEKLIAKPGSKDTEIVLAGANTALAAVQERFDNRVSAINWLTENGYPIRALDDAKDLLKAVSKNDTMKENVSSLVDRLESDEFKQQMKWDKSLTKLEMNMFIKKEGDPRSISKIEELAQEAGDTPVAKRAEELAYIAKFAKK